MRRLKGILKNPRYIAGLIVWIVSFLAYILSASNGPSGVADADEFLSIAAAGGVAHSPGYPLYTTLLEATLAIPIPIRIPLKSALLSSAFQATAGVFLFLISQLLVQTLFTKKNRGGKQQNQALVLQLLGVLLVQTNLLLWQYATISEVFALTNLFFAASTYLWLKVAVSPQKKRAFIAAFVWGLGVAHHYLLLGLFPLALATLASTRKKRTKSMELVKHWSVLLVTFSGAFGLSQALLLWRMSRDTLVSWVFAPTLQGWWQFVSRGLYSGTLADGSQSVGLLAPIVLSDAIKSVSDYVMRVAPTHVGVVPLILSLVCIAWLMRERQSLWVYGLLSSTLIMTVGVVVVLAIPVSVDALQYQELLTLVERMYLPGYMLLGMIVPLGLILLRHWLKVKTNVVPRFAFDIIAFLALVATGVFNYREFAHLKVGYPGPLRIKSRLLELPQNSVLACFSDLTCFTTMYYLSVEKIRPDIQLIPVSEQLRFAQGPNHIIARYPDNPLRLSYVAAEALQKNNPLFISQLTPLYDEIWNINHTFALDSAPIFKQLKCGIEEKSPKNVPMAIYPDNKLSPTKLSSILYQRSFINAELDGYHGALECPSASQVAQQALECSSYGCQLKLGLLATMLDPDNSTYRSMLAGFYELQLFMPLAIREYQVAYTLDPSNATAAAALTRLDQSLAYPVDLEGL
jgi:hypothetical protein